MKRVVAVMVLWLALCPRAYAEKVCQDYSCIIKAAETCEESRMALVHVQDIGFEINGRTIIAIEGMEDNRCIVDERLKIISVTLSDQERKEANADGIPDDVLDKRLEEFRENFYSVRHVRCAWPVENLVQKLKSDQAAMEEGVFNIDISVMAGTECEETITYPDGRVEQSRTLGGLPMGR